MADSGNQEVVVERQHGNSETEEMRRFKRTTRNIGFVVYNIGLICVILGLVLLSNAGVSVLASLSSIFKGRVINVGEGLWCGIWILIAGMLGIACGKKTLSPCLANTHFAFSILATIFSAAMFAASVAVVMNIELGSFHGKIEITLAVLSGISLILCATSACLWCCASPFVDPEGTCCRPLKGQTKRGKETC